MADEPQVPQTQAVSTTDAPSGDIPFADLFPEADEGSLTTANVDSPTRAAQPQVIQDAQRAAAAQAAADADFFLRGQESVYKTREAAIEGLNSKDLLIKQLREQVAQQTGVDPLKQNSSVQTRPPAAQPPAASAALVNYVQDPDKFYDDAVSAVQRGDKKGWANVQAQFISDLLAPYQPILQDAGRSRAVQQVSGEIKDVNDFLHSSEYTETLTKLPVLKQAIDNAENNPGMYNQLPQLYQIAYYSSRGVQLPKLLEAANQSKPNIPQPQVRAPMTPTTQAPAVRRANNDLATAEGRKQYIADMESRGILDVAL